MKWRIFPALVAVLVLLAAGCVSNVNVVATAFAPTPAPAPGTPVDGVSVVPLTPGAQMSGVIQQAGEEHQFTFAGSAGQAVTIDMQAPSGGRLDSYLELRDAGGSTLITNDDSNGLDSRIGNYVLPADGEYTVLAYGFGHSSTGSYSLNMIIGTPVPTPPPTPLPPPGGGPIAVGDQRPGHINSSGEVVDWQLTGSAGEYVTILLNTDSSGYLDPYLELIGPNGATLRVDDDGGSGLNALISNMTLPEDGTYTIRTSGLGSSVGGFELIVQRGAPPTATLPPPTPGPSPTPFDRQIGVSQQIDGQLRPNTGGDTFVLSVDYPTAVEIIVQAESDTYNLYLEMTEPNGISRDLVEYGNARSLLFVPGVFLRTPGDYTFRVRAIESRFINYQLIVNEIGDTRQISGEIAYGQGVSGFLRFSGQRDVWTFEGQQGDKITILMYGSTGLDTYLELLNEDGATITTNDDAPGGGTSDSAIRNYRLPRDGVYTIVAASYRGNSAGPYRLQLFANAE